MQRFGYQFQLATSQLPFLSLHHPLSSRSMHSVKIFYHRQWLGLVLTLLGHVPVAFPLCVCSVEDYWIGYKMFCFAYYSNSSQHEAEFQRSKLGWSRCPIAKFYVLGCSFVFNSTSSQFSCWICLSRHTKWVLFCPGQLVWRRHTGLPRPSRRLLRSTCVHLLPLVEMFCKWELQEDCSNLQSLMQRFDSESELESHELGRSLLFMIRDDDTGVHNLPQLASFEAPINPFDAVRERLAAADLAIRVLHTQVTMVAPLRNYMVGAHSWSISLHILDCGNLWIQFNGVCLGVFSSTYIN